jgi:putative MATE family efflux protein
MAEEGKTSEKKAYYGKDWTKGSVIRNLVFLSWPMVVMESLYVVSQIVDMIWVGKLGSSSIAGVGIANIILGIVMSMDIGLIVGVRAMIARARGEGNNQKANHIAGQSITLSVIWGSIMMLTGLLIAGPMLGLFGVEAKVISEGLSYLRIMFLGWVALDILVMSLYIVQSAGDTIRPMIVEAVIRSVHVVLCPLLVLGYGGFPRMGTSGAALSNVLSQVLGAAIMIGLLFSGRTRLRITFRDFRLVPNIVLRILKIGIPVLIMNLQRSFGNLALTWLIAPFGTLAVAAHSLVTRVEMFLYMPSFGLGMGAGVLVGQNLGAKQPQQAAKSAWLAVGFVEIFMMVSSAAILLWAETIMGIFTSEPGLIRLGSDFLRIATAAFVLFAFVSVLQSGIAGAGDTLPNMVISIALIWAIQLPLASILPQVAGLGVYGVRWAVVASTFVGAVAYSTYFIIGRWKTKKI